MSETEFHPPEQFDHPQLQVAIDAYLLKREQYFKRYYPDSVDVMLEGERKMIEENRKNGMLSDWKPGEDILRSITIKIEARVTTPTEAVDVGTQFSESIPKALRQELEEAKRHGRIVSMNEAKTFSLNELDGMNNESVLFSPGQGGCNTFVIAGKEENGNVLISVLHFDPTSSTSLIDALVQERKKYSHVKETKIVGFLLKDDEDLRQNLSISIGLFPLPHYEEKETNEASSANEEDGILIVRIQKSTKEIHIRMKGQTLQWQL